MIELENEVTVAEDEVEAVSEKIDAEEIKDGEVILL